jgi:hypothetical protein
MPLPTGCVVVVALRRLIRARAPGEELPDPRPESGNGCGTDGEPGQQGLNEDAAGARIEIGVGRTRREKDEDAENYQP